ncbi:MAG: hypothetical protein ACLPSW_30475 [Roseiarcus sp.]
MATASLGFRLDRRRFQIHAKDFQICAPFLQTFPKIPLAVLWEIKGLQGKKGNFVLLQIFFPAPRPKAAARSAGEAGASNRDKGRLASFSVFQNEMNPSGALGDGAQQLSRHIRDQLARLLPSWPGLSRPSTR